MGTCDRGGEEFVTVNPSQLGNSVTVDTLSTQATTARRDLG
jgi:hypothetical protein